MANFDQKVVLAHVTRMLTLASEEGAFIVGDFLGQLVRHEANPKCEIQYRGIDLWIQTESLDAIIATINNGLKDSKLKAVGWHTTPALCHDQKYFECNFYVRGMHITRLFFIASEQFPFNDIDVNYLCGRFYRDNSEVVYSTHQPSHQPTLSIELLKRDIMVKQAHLMPEFCQRLLTLAPTSTEARRSVYQITNYIYGGWKIFYKSVQWQLSRYLDPVHNTMFQDWLRKQMADPTPTPTPAPTLQAIVVPSTRDQVLAEFDALLVKLREKFIQALD